MVLSGRLLKFWKVLRYLALLFMAGLAGWFAMAVVPSLSAKVEVEDKPRRIESVRTLPDAEPVNLAVSPDGRAAACILKDGVLLVFDEGGMQRLRKELEGAPKPTWDPATTSGGWNKTHLQKPVLEKNAGPQTAAADIFTGPGVNSLEGLWDSALKGKYVWAWVHGYSTQQWCLLRPGYTHAYKADGTSRRVKLPNSQALPGQVKLSGEDYAINGKSTVFSLRYGQGIKYGMPAPIWILYGHGLQGYNTIGTKKGLLKYNEGVGINTPVPSSGFTLHDVLEHAPYSGTKLVVYLGCNSGGADHYEVARRLIANGVTSVLHSNNVVNEAKVFKFLEATIKNLSVGNEIDLSSHHSVYQAAEAAVAIPGGLTPYMVGDGDNEYYPVSVNGQKVKL